MTSVFVPGDLKFRGILFIMEESTIVSIFYGDWHSECVDHGDISLISSVRDSSQVVRHA